LYSESKGDYYIKSIIKHTGTLEFGHYYSHTKIGDKWVEFDDKNVSILNNGISLDCSSAYSLFYSLNY